MLIGNYSVLNKTPGRWLSGGSTAGTNQAQTRANFLNNGSSRNAHYADGAATALKTLGYPQGGYDQSSFMLPYTESEMTSREEGNFAVTATATGVLGLPATGSATITITVPDATAQLIASGEGSASFAVTTNNPLLTASVGGTGTASFAVTANTPILGAIASLTASASFAVTGTLVPYAIGNMVGTTDVSTGPPTAEQNALAVWSALLGGGAISAEDALLAAGSAGDPWSTPLPGSYVGTQAGAILDQMRGLVTEFHRLQGLDAANPVTHTPDAINAGSLSLVLTGDGVSSRTVQRA